MAGPLAVPGPWDDVAEHYVKENLVYFDVFANEALDEAAESYAGAHVVDVCCGPGTLSLLAARRGARVKAIDFSPAMIEQLHKRAGAQATKIDAVVGDGQALPYGDDEFDVAFSLFGLLFFPDRDRGFRELLRVLKPGGVAVVSSWVEIRKLPLYWDAISTFCEVTKQPPPPPGAVLGDEPTFRAELEAAGFVDVVISQRSTLLPFASVTAMLRHMERGNAMIRLAKKAMGDDAFAEVFLRWNLAMLEKHAGAVEMPLVANLGRGQKRG